MQPSDPDLARGKRASPRWSVFVPLLVVVAALVSLVVIPPLITEEPRELREELTVLHDPLSRLIGSLERATGSELGAARGYALTGDPFFVDRFLVVHRYGDALAHQVDSLATLLGGQVQDAADQLLETRAYWVQANFGRTRADFREGLAEHQQHFDAVIAASFRLQEVLARRTSEQHARIARAEQVRARVSDLLTLIALLGAAAALWLAYGLHRKDAQLRAASIELQRANDSLEERVRERTLRIRQLSRDLTLAEQRERRQLADVLHDDLQQLLFALRLNLESLSAARPASQADLSEELAQNRSIIDEAIAATRNLTADLSPPLRAGGGAGEMLAWLAEHVRDRFGLIVEVRAPGDIQMRSDDVRLLVFQTVRELLFNVVKHAGTEKAVIEVGQEGGELAIDVIDHGSGFTPTNGATMSASAGLGLRGARERIELLGGRIEIESAPGKGTRARIAIPVDLIAG